MCDENTVEDNEAFFRKSDSMTRRQFAALTATLDDFGNFLMQIRDQRLHRVVTGAGLFGLQLEVGLYGSHNADLKQIQ